MKKIILAIALLATLTSCEKKPCKVNSTGDLILSNNTNNPINVYLDNGWLTQVPGWTIITKTNKNAGFHTYKGIQANGYTLYPTEWTGSITIVKCSTVTLTFN